MTEKEGKTRLLIVDDEDEFRAAACQALTRLGFEVSDASSGERALEMIRVSPPDVVVLDLRMGGMDGIAALEQIREIEKNLPVVILTGHGKFGDALASIQLDVVDFVQKPAEMEDLAARIRRLLGRATTGKPREKSICDLMVPVHTYRKFYVDQTLQEVVGSLVETLFKAVGPDEVIRRARRAVLICDRDETFAGLVRVEDIVRTMVPAFLRDSPYSSYFTGMFLAQSKLIRNTLAGELISRRRSIEIDAPLMEAVAIMVTESLTNLPVFRHGKLVGILRDEDVFKEIADSVLGH